MEGTVIVVPLVVSNQTKSLEFYTEKVGLEKKTDQGQPGGPRWVTVGLKGQPLEITLWQAGAPSDPSQKEYAKQWAPGKTPPILIRVPDCKKAYEELRGRGVEFVTPAMEAPWGWVAVFRDPDGNLVSLSQPPSGGPRP